MSGQQRTLTRGEYICSINKKYQFGLTMDGYLVICSISSEENQGVIIWSAQEDKPNTKTGNYAVLQKGGNFVLYNDSSKALWSTETGGNLNSKVTLTNSGSVKVTNNKNQDLWIVQPNNNNDAPSQPTTPVQQPQPSNEKCEFSTTGDDCFSEINMSMTGNERTLDRGEKICSSNQDYYFGLTNDGILSICNANNGMRLWSLDSSSSLDNDKEDASYVALQKSGNFVLYNQKMQPIWQTKTGGNTNARIQILDDGRVSLSNRGVELWSAEPIIVIIPTVNPTAAPTKNPTEFPTVSTPQPTQSPTPLDPLVRCEFDPDLLDEPLCDGKLHGDMPNSRRRMFAGEFICSPNKEFFFGMTLDGYLAICEKHKKVWKKGPFEGPNVFSQFQTDGNLVVYSDTQNPDVLYKSGTKSQSATLRLQDNGALKIISVDGNIVWERIPEHGIRSLSPTISPHPTVSPTISPKPTVSFPPIGSTTYSPGKLQYNEELGIYLSDGLTGRLIAETGENVLYSSGQKSNVTFHDQPDAGGCFDAEDGSGWYYMSNAEVGDGEDPDGGVGRIKFNSNGDVMEYKMVLQGTRMNCGSGITPWDTYITCEEFRGGKNRPSGQCWEVHPEEKWQPRPTKMGGVDGGKFESAAFDRRNMRRLKGFVTTDSSDGPVLRYTPNPITLESALLSGDFSQVLHTNGGIVEYLVVNNQTQTFEWSLDKVKGEVSAEYNYPNVEGIDVHEGQMYFTSKKLRELFILDLDEMTYTSSSTKSGAFNGQPDQIVRLLPPTTGDLYASVQHDNLLYFLEDGGNSPAGVFARDQFGKYLTIAEGGDSNSDESTGLAFCDKGRRMIFAFQDEGKVFEVMRDDGQPFYGQSLDIKYHNV